MGKKEKKIIANVLLARCKNNKRLYGITIEQDTPQLWNMKYSYPIDEHRAKSEGFDKTKITADCVAANDFPGCPFCGSMGYVKCGQCGKLTCYKDEVSMKCAWCNNNMDNIGYYGPMDISIGSD